MKNYLKRLMLFYVVVTGYSYRRPDVSIYVCLDVFPYIRKEVVQLQRKLLENYLNYLNYLECVKRTKEGGYRKILSPQKRNRCREQV